TFDNVEIAGADLIESPDPATPFGGVLGCAVLCNFSTTLNYRDAQLVLGEGMVVQGVGASVEVPFRLEGGGLGTIPGVSGIMTIPPSRIALSATIEGTSHSVLIDTGATVSLVRRAVFDDLVADGRPQVTLGVSSTQGTSESSVFRLRSLA